MVYFGYPVALVAYVLSKLPTRLGGLCGIFNPVLVVHYMILMICICTVSVGMGKGISYITFHVWNS